MRCLAYIKKVTQRANKSTSRKTYDAIQSYKKPSIKYCSEFGNLTAMNWEQINRMNFLLL